MNKLEISPPPLMSRIFSVWYRHVKVYIRHFISNALPPFLEPLIFLSAIGLGLGLYIDEMGGRPYIQFLASGMVLPAAMYTASFEATFGTFIRMEFEKVYDGMLAASIDERDLILGEILFCATKGFFFSLAVLLVITLLGWGAFPFYPAALAVPFVGFIAGWMFAALALVVTSFVETINHFNFYFSGFISPLFFFSGIVFPVENLPAGFRWVAEVLPLAHQVRLTRAFFFADFSLADAWDWLYCVVFSVVLTVVALVRLKRRLID